MVAVRPLTPDRWPDVVRLFGKGGPCEGCWCMFWRQTGREHQRNAGNGNRQRLRAIVDERVPGVLAYQDDRPVGWCAVAPREEFGRIERSPALRPLDGEPAWSVVCFYITPPYRRQGVARALLAGAVRFAVDRGARIVEGYPVDTGGGRVDNSGAYTGVISMFLEAGFQEVARRGGRRLVMRYYA